MSRNFSRRCGLQAVVALWIILIAGGLSSCVLKSPMPDVQTNTTVVLPPPVEITNTVTVIQPVILTQSGNFAMTVSLTNSNFTLSGHVYLTNLLNESYVQPSFSLKGYFDSSLKPYLLNFEVIANSNRFYPVSISNNLWEVAILNETNAYLPLEIRAYFEGGLFRTLLNLNITNIPFVQMPSTNTHLLTNVASLSWSGEASVVDLNGESISKVMLFVTDESNNQQTYPCALSNIPGWTNSIKNYLWSANLNLSHGDNTISGYVLSSSGLSNSIPTVTITRSLIGVDGVKDDVWKNAFMAGNSSPSNFAGYTLGNLYITNDSQNIFFYVEISNMPPLASEYNGPRLSLSIDSISNSGLTNDAWGGSFVFDTPDLPDIQIQCRITTSGGQAVYLANSSNWVNIANNWDSTGMNGVKMSVQTNGGFEFAVPLSLVNLQFGQSIRVIAILSGLDGDNGNKQVWNVIPESVSNAVATNENDLSSVLHVLSPSYTLQ